jgi:type VII secretion protein EccB
MASRRDQLNAYNFARKRTVAAFLQPTANGSEEGAPRPVRAIVPSLAVAALLLAGFGGWGLIKPSAPPNWDKPYANVLVGSESTTRYVVLKAPHEKPKLHPVLNMASARLLLNSDNFSVLKIDESLLDSGKLEIGATVGIPYAPDRLPDAGNAGAVKVWSVCEQNGSGADPTKAVFVLDGRDQKFLTGPGVLSGPKALYVMGPGHVPYLVTADGTAYPIATTAAPTSDGTSGDPQLLLRTLFGTGARPQQVTADWLQTFHQGRTISFPDLTGVGQSAGVPGLPQQVNRVGMVIAAPSGSTTQEYVVLQGKVEPVTHLVAELLMNLPAAQSLYPAGTAPKAQPMGAAAFRPSDTEYLGDNHWPSEIPKQANIQRTSAPQNVCSVYRGTMNGSTPRLSVWTGDRYPVKNADVGTSAYVTPGTGLLYRQVTGTGTSGALYLVTDTGLRYNLPGGTGGQSSDNSAARLGYGQVKPQLVPANWSAFLPVGPKLDSVDAVQEQGS